MILPTLQVKTVQTNIYDLAYNYKLGKYVTFNKWLQRTAQEKKWTAKQHKKAKSYLNQQLHTHGAIQGFYIAPIPFLIANIEDQKENQPEMADLWSELLDWLKEKQKNGATHIILDGQNRLKFSIVPFLFEDLTVDNLNTDNGLLNNALFKDLDESTQQQIRDIPVLLSLVIGGDVISVVNSLISINEGEPWNACERRSVQLTPVSFKINRLVSHPNVVSFHTQIQNNVFNGKDYAMEKKGDVLFVSEHLHFIRNKKPGSKSSLDIMYAASDETMKNDLKLMNDQILWLSNNLKNHPKILEKITSKEVYRDILIFLNMLTNKQARGNDELPYTVNLDQIKEPEVFIEDLLEELQTKLKDVSQFEPDKDEDGNIIYENGQPKYRVANVKPGTFYNFHKNSSEVDLKGREKLFIKDYSVFLDECVAAGVIQTKDARKLGKFEKMQAQAKFNGDTLDRFPTTNLEVLSGKELDHIVSVKKGGTGDVDNLQYISKTANRTKAAN